jgi:AMMECR1 domain-containing protein
MNVSIKARDILFYNAFETIKGNLFNEVVTYLVNDDDFLNEKHGIFVSVYVDDKLRGVKGTHKPRLNVYDMIPELLSNFCDCSKCDIKLEKHELPYTRIKISLMSNLEQIYSEEDIVIGKHGLVIKNFEGEGAILPSEGVEHGCGRAMFLNEACHKAGLASYKWQDDDCHVFRFEVVSFEKDFNDMK